MSITPYFFLEKRQKDNSWHRLSPMISENGHMVRADLFPFNVCHDMFDILYNRGDCPIMDGIHAYPDDISEEVKNEFGEELCGEGKKYVRYFNYAALVIYLLKHPTVPIFNENTGKTETAKNPLTFLDERIKSFLMVCDAWDWKDNITDYRVIFWLD